MIVAFGTSTPTSITVVATRTSSSRALKLAITPRRSAGRQPPVEAADAVAAELGRAEPLGLLLGGARDARLGRLDQRADDVGLAPVVEVPAEARVRLGAAVVGDPGRDDRLAVRRRERELAHLEVAVDRERERSRDRGRRQVEDVRAAPLDERGALRDAEAVLLVDDGDGEVAEVDLLLDEGVRPDDDLRVARRDELPDQRRAPSRASELVSSVTRTPSGAHSSSIVRKCCSASVSVGAMSAPWRPTSTARRSACSATTVFPDPTSPWRSRCIGIGPVEVGVDLGHRALLVRRERERERGAIARDELARLAERLGGRALARGRRAQEREPEDEELVEREPRPPDLGLGERPRAMHDGERVRADREALGREQRRRAGRRRRREHARAPARGGRGAVFCATSSVGGIDGCEVARLRLAVEVVRGDGEAVPVRTAPDANRRARRRASTRATAG